MRKLLGFLIAAALLAPALGHAQASASVQLQLGLPVVLPQMVVVQPGIQVVPDVDEEVFRYNGWYWVRRDDGWYRSQHHRHGWYPVRSERVPRKLVALPPGQYRRWHPPPPAPRPAPVRYYRPAPPPPRPEPARWGDDRGHGKDDDRGEGHHREGKGHDHGERKGHDRDW